MRNVPPLGKDEGEMMMVKVRKLILVGLWGLSYGLPAMGQTRSQVYGDQLTRQAQTFYVRGTAGMTSFDSQTADSKETQSTMGYELGGWLGESRIVGIRVASRQDKIPFDLNASRSEQNFTDVRVSGRLWFLTPSIGVSTSEVNVEAQDSPKVGVIATGLSAGLGANLVVHDNIIANLDVMTVRSNRVYDKLSKNTNLGDRQELDGNIAFDLTDRMVDLLIGYNLRRFQLQTSEATYVEQAQGAYAGVRLGLYF